MSRGLLPRNSTSHVRRTPVRRNPPRLRGIQIGAVIFMAACLGGFLAVSYAPSFAAKTLEIHGATFTSPEIIRSILGMDGSPNTFRIETDRAAEKMVRLPAIQSASVVAKLPSTVVVTIVERVPRLVWAIGENRYVVDQDGLLFGLVDSAGNPIPSSAGPLPTPGGPSPTPASPTPRVTRTPTASVESPSPSPMPKKTPTKAPGKATPTKPGAKPSATPAAASGSPGPTYDPSLIPSLAPAPTADPGATSGPSALGLPVVFDRRESDAGLTLGGVIDPTNLDAGYRLANLTPTEVGTKAASLAVVIDDVHGFTVSSGPDGWVAEFGFYAPTVRQTTVIPTLVRDLRSTLAYYGEAKVAWVFLVSDVSSNHIDTVILR
jgi:POTRA domain, FtsQ-type